MRIAMISENATPLAADDGFDTDGRHRHIAELSDAMARLGHEVRVYTRRTAPDLPDQLRLPSGVVVEHLSTGPAQVLPPAELMPLTGDFGQRLAERWQSRLWQPDIAHAHFSPSGLAALAARSSFPVPLVVTYHTEELEPGRGRRNGTVNYDRIIGTQADRVVAQCSAEVRALIDRGVPRRSINLVPSGVDADLFTPDGPAARRSHPGRVLSVGTLSELDGHADLIRALRMLPGTAALIVGGPSADELGGHPQARLLRELAEEHQVTDRVTVTGAVRAADMPRLYRSADLVACTRLHEPYGQASLEAMACGIPVVGYATGALTDTVIDGVTGTLVPTRDERGLARSIRRLLRDPIRRMAFATASIDRARACYSWQRTAEQMQRIYTDLRAGYTARLGTPAAGAALAG